MALSRREFLRRSAAVTAAGVRYSLRHDLSRLVTCLIFCVLALLAAVPGHGQNVPAQAPTTDIGSDTWVGTDALGRALPTAAGTRAPRKDRFAGIFYFLTHGSAQYYTATGPLDYSAYGDNPKTLRDNTQIIKAAGGDPLTKPQAWAQGGTYWWGEPAVGYFLADDPWVARKNLQMLAEAGVDVIIFDVTNGPTYSNAYHTILDTAEAMRRAGDPTPQFMFITYSSTGPVANGLYDAIYAKGLWRDLWFRWNGKPLIFGDPNGSKPVTTPPRPEVQRFFTWRYSWANTKGPSGNGKDEWEWADSGDPQLFGWHVSPAQPEEMPVMVGGWANGDIGRSFQGGDQPWGITGHEPPLDQNDLAADVDKGLFFSQEWQNALKVDPQFLFVTGWNEWTAGRQYGPGVTMLGHVTQPGQYYFVDEYNQEFSRDAMPMQGGHADNYYMQLVDGIRQFKGVRPTPVAHGMHTISLSAPFAQWNAVQPIFHAFAGSAQHRDWPGWGGAHYINTTGRNAVVLAKVAADAKTVAFYAQTEKPLTPHTDPHWMQLLVATRGAGWHGYDFLVNGRVLTNHTTTLTRLTDGKTWTVPYRAAGNQLELLIPRHLLGLSDTRHIQCDFHWIDNVAVGPGGEDPAQWWYNGVSAPDGRFNFRFIAE